MVGEGRPSTSLPATSNAFELFAPSFHEPRGPKAWMLGTSPSMTKVVVSSGAMVRVFSVCHGFRTRLWQTNSWMVGLRRP
jgi:hypothetical protein